MTKEDWGQKALEAYNEFVAELLADDDEVRNLAFKLILDFCDALDKHSGLKTRTKSAHARMVTARAQFTMLAASYHNLEDMEVFGMIIYKGTDATTKQLSVIFGGSDTIKTLIELNQIDVRQVLDDFSACIRYVMHCYYIFFTTDGAFAVRLNLPRKASSCPLLADTNSDQNAKCRAGARMGKTTKKTTKMMKVMMVQMSEGRKRRRTSMTESAVSSHP